MSVRVRPPAPGKYRPFTIFVTFRIVAFPGHLLFHLLNRPITAYFEQSISSFEEGEKELERQKRLAERAEVEPDNWLLFEMFRTMLGPTSYREAIRHSLAPAVTGPIPQDVIPILWNTPASMLTYENGKPYKFECPAGGKESTIWGTAVYTADSSVCTAAVHAGVIKFESGGTVTIELWPGQSSYQGTLRNSVKSSDYGAYARSFVVK